MKLEDKHPNFFTPLDDEEAELIKDLDNEEFASDDKSEVYMKQNREMAKNTLIKKPVNLRIQERDLTFFRVKALEEWIPYQTLISSVIHRYAEGTLKRGD